MNKLKKMLLISFLTLLSSCGPQIPEPPEAMRVVPMWLGGRVNAWYGRWMISQQTVTLTLQEGRDLGLMCIDADGYAKEAAYPKEMRDLIEKRCR